MMLNPSIQAIRDRSAEAARIRGQAIHSQLALGFTLCALAEQSIVFGHFNHANKIVERLWPSAHTIARHLAEPHYVPPSLIPELRAALQRLDGRITEIEARLVNGEQQG